MSYPNVDSTPARSPTQAEIDAVSPQRAIDALYRTLSRFVGVLAEDWRRCGKVACLRSRRCRGFACEPDVGDGGRPSR